MKDSFSKSSILLLCAPFLAMSGCATNNNSIQKAEGSNVVTTSFKTEKNETVGYQLELPQIGEEIAVVTTSMGQFKLRFFS